ncbi:MAG: U32 family peptidase [Clostridia bacterium]|nr:U32 family peptidase [Clostridia bacterium]
MKPYPMELLAPAGSWESMVAAVRAGADAVYMGAEGFNARRYAAGFSANPTDEHSLYSAVGYCHIRGVKVHVALNVLVSEAEFEHAMEAARVAVEAGADALIVQDRGLARAIHAVYPALPLHASTQLTCHTPRGVDRLREDGFSRVVLAREMTAAEIAACADRGAELEVFVHGALCMSVSGQCELSALLGGRSGNRGMCAGPCRLPFAVGHPPHDDYALSLKDNCLRHHLHTLYNSGVASLKIEGRMKRPEYVAAATAAFRRLLDGGSPDEQLQQDLESVFSRSGFTDGYFTGRRDETMFGKRRYEDVTAADKDVLTRLARLYEKETPRVPLAACLSVNADAPAVLTVSDGTVAVTAQGEVPQAALTRPLTADRAAEQLQKTGGTPFRFDNVTCEIGEGLALPLSALNALRRNALEQLEQRRASVGAVSEGDAPSPVPLPRGLLGGLVARVENEDQITDGADWYVVPLGFTPSVSGWGVEIPRGLFGREEETLRRLREAKAQGAKFALCGNVGAIPLALEAGLPPVAGWSLHITNRQALAAAAESGVQAAVMSFELTRHQLQFAKQEGCTGLFAYGRQPLMLMRNCPVKAVRSCADCGGRSHLVDRKGVKFPVTCGGGCSELLNSVPLYTADRPDLTDGWTFLYLHFTDETPERVAQVLREYREGGQPPQAFTRGLYDKGWAKKE